MNNAIVTLASRVSVSQDAAMVGASVKSVLKLFLLERRLIGVMSAGNLDQFFGLITCERRLFSHSAKPATAARIDEGNPQFRLQSVRKS